MLDQKIEITQEGLDNLRKELEHLESVEKPNNIEALKEARAQGDLSENADYDAARDDQARINGRINEIENIIKNHVLIVRRVGEIGTGSKVLLKYEGESDATQYEIVGPTEADPVNGKISNQSPVAIAISGRKKGEQITFQAENGKYHNLEIVDTVE